MIIKPVGIPLRNYTEVTSGTERTSYYSVRAKFSHYSCSFLSGQRLSITGSNSRNSIYPQLTADKMRSETKNSLCLANSIYKEMI